MTLYSIMLFVHLAALAVLFAGMGIAHLALRRARAATTAATVRPWLMTFAGLKHVFPAASVVLLLSGFELARERDFWSHGWVWVAIAGVALMLVLGATVNAAWGRSVGRALAGEPDGTLSDATRARLRSPSIMMSAHLNIGLVAAIMYLMIAKPGGAAAGALALSGALLGIGYGRWAARGSADALRAPERREARAHS
jgi:hypothetical protein